MHSSLRRSGLLNGCLFVLAICLFFALFAGEWMVLLAMLAGTVLTSLFLDGKI